MKKYLVLFTSCLRIYVAYCIYDVTNFANLFCKFVHLSFGKKNVLNAKKCKKNKGDTKRNNKKCVKESNCCKENN